MTGHDPIPATIAPHGTSTGHRHAKCFASPDENCSTTISREHFISETLLRQIELNKTAKIAGLSWQQPKTFDIIPLKGLASKILCDRHNSALSPLDATMGAFSQAIADIDRDLHPDADAPRFQRRQFCGEDLERWMLKCLIGMSVSGNIGGGLNPKCLDLLYDRIPWPTGWGLYWLIDRGPVAHHASSFLIETNVHPQTNVIMFVRFTMRGLPLGLCLGKPDQPSAFGILRPSALSFRSGHRRRQIMLRWSRDRAGAPIQLNRAGTYDGPSPDWLPWERNG
ncbi:MAG: hypothetical protein ABL904_10900 [Hyphomicrobiaceae bacterium]